MKNEENGFKLLVLWLFWLCSSEQINQSNFVQWDLFLIHIWSPHNFRSVEILAIPMVWEISCRVLFCLSTNSFKKFKQVNVGWKKKKTEPASKMFIMWKTLIYAFVKNWTVDCWTNEFNALKLRSNLQNTVGKVIKRLQKTPNKYLSLCFVNHAT